MSGYISQFGRANSVNNFDNDIVSVVYQKYLDECFEVMENGYKSYLMDTEKEFSTDETLITAGICDHIENIIDTSKLPLDIVPEYMVYSEEIKKGKLTPKKAKRFDLRILRWNEENAKFKFGVEAKLLAETNYNSKNASNLIKEYVEDAGMGKFINKIYDQKSYNVGFMLGHILNGKTENIIPKINDKITSTYSIAEQITDYKEHYISHYLDNGKRKNIYHIFLNFSVLAN